MYVAGMCFAGNLEEVSMFGYFSFATGHIIFYHSVLCPCYEITFTLGQ